MKNAQGVLFAVMATVAAVSAIGFSFGIGYLQHATAPIRPVIRTVQAPETPAPAVRSADILPSEYRAVEWKRIKQLAVGQGGYVFAMHDSEGHACVDPDAIITDYPTISSGWKIWRSSEGLFLEVTKDDPIYGDVNCDRQLVVHLVLK